MNSVRSLTFGGRLPGVVCQTALPPAGEAPLRLDVAGFVGFAERGPVDTPVALEDFSQYTAVFGGDLMVARDGGRPVYAHLPGAVAAFFDNGGRRCYVVRVAGETRVTNRFAVPGLVAVGSAGDVCRVVAGATSPGRWSDRVTVNTQLRRRPLPVYPAGPGDPPLGPFQIALELPATLPVGPGDLLALTFADGANSLWFFPISKSVRAGAAATTRGGRVVVSAEPAAVRAFGRVAPSPLPLVLKVERLAETGWSPLPLNWAELSGDDDQLDLLVPLATDARPGDLLRVTCAGGAALLFPVDRLSLAEIGADAAPEASPPGSPPAGSPPLGVAPQFDLRLSAAAPLWEQPAPAAIPRAALAQVDLLTFDLTIAEGDAVPEVFTDLRFSPGPRYWADALGRPGRAAPDLASGRSLRLAAPEAALVPPPDPADPDADQPPLYLPLGMPALPDPDLAAGPLPRTDGGTGGKDGLDSFSPVALFLDSRLARAGMRHIMAEAEYLLYQSAGEPPLCGVHALLPVEEVALIAVPDLAHRGWFPAAPLPLPPPAPVLPAAPPDWTRFRDCPTPPLPRALSPEGVVRAFLERLTAGDEDGARETLSPGLLVTLPAAASALFLLGLDAVPAAFAVAPPPCRPLENLEAEVRVELALTSGARPPYLFRLARTRAGEGSPTEWRIAAVALQVPAAVTSDAARELALLPALETPADFRVQPARLDALLAVHNALLSLCAGRRDAVAVLSLPEHFDRADVLAWEAALRGANPDSDGLALSYAAVYHPWVQLRETATPELALLRHQPPDGAACGIIAARELARGPWIAPAALTLRGVVGLVPGVGEADWVDLFDARVNLLRREPGRFTEMSAHTLSADLTLLQLSVRRLLIYLRKLCLRRGMEYVFEPNDERFRRRVEAGLERAMERLTAAGALAAYQVVTGEGLNTPNDRDNGRFIVAIKVAPAQPIEFITVALLRTGEGLLQVVEA